MNIHLRYECWYNHMLFEVRLALTSILTYLNNSLQYLYVSVSCENLKYLMVHSLRTLCYFNV